MDRRPAGDRGPGHTPGFRIALVILAGFASLVVLVAVGFGAKSACTSSPPTDSPACDAVDTWLWIGSGGFVTAASLAALVPTKPPRRILVGLAVASMLIAGTVMTTVSP